ncbi:UNVERIFIED_CONTAM: hypothetical protein Slati_3879700, partial [Sesamum latifolium]
SSQVASSAAREVARSPATSSQGASSPGLRPRARRSLATGGGWSLFWEGKFDLMRITFGKDLINYSLFGIRRLLPCKH